MNYYEARQLSDKSGWHFTCRNDGQISPVGYCANRESLTAEWICMDCDGAGCEKCGGGGTVKRRIEPHVHETREEAEECFLRYLLDDISDEEYGDWTGCEVCGEPTKKGLTSRRPLGNGFPLCDEHRTPEILAGLTAWPSKIVASY